MEYETGADLKTAVEKIDGREFKGESVHCIADVRKLIHSIIFTPYLTEYRFSRNAHAIVFALAPHQAAAVATVPQAAMRNTIVVGRLEATVHLEAIATVLHRPAVTITNVTDTLALHHAFASLSTTHLLGDQCQMTDILLLVAGMACVLLTRLTRMSMVTGVVVAAMIDRLHRGDRGALDVVMTQVMTEGATGD